MSREGSLDEGEGLERPVVLGLNAMLVLDTKYADPERRTRFRSHSFRNEDLYQIAFYANEYGCPGLLVYPRADRGVRVVFEAAAAQCAIVTVDLSSPGLTGMEGARSDRSRAAQGASGGAG